jgi:hypothetical protein
MMTHLVATTTTTTTTTTTMDPTVRHCFARNHARVCPVPPQRMHRPMSSPHSRRNHRPCDDDDDGDDHDDSNNNARMCHAYTPDTAAASGEPIEARGGNECKETAKEAAKVTQVWKETNRASNASEPYNAIPPKKQKTQTKNKKIVRTHTVPNEEEMDAHAAVQRAHHHYKKEEHVWMDNTCTPKDSASAETTTTKSKLGACRSHKENHKKQRKKKDNTKKNIIKK